MLLHKQRSMALIDNTNLKYNSPSSPLEIRFAFFDDETIVRRKLKMGAEVNKANSFGRTPLLMFLQRKDCPVGIVEVLLDFKADVNQKDMYGNTPLAVAIRNSNDDAVIRVLVKRGAEVNDFKNTYNTPLLVLLRERKKCSVHTVKLLLAKGADINCVDEVGNSPLATALRQSRDEAIIQALLEGGADVNTLKRSKMCVEVNKEDSFGRTPLLMFLQRKYCCVGFVEVLLDFKADVNRKDVYGNSPLAVAIRNSNDDAVIRVLVERGAEVNDFKNTYNTPLLVLLRERKNCSVDTVKLLLAKGAFINCEDKDGNSPLAVAIQNSNDDAVIRVLVERGAEVNDFENTYNTPLFLMLRERKNCSVDTVKLLLAKGANINCVDKDGDSPLVTALKLSRDEAIIQALLEGGANVNLVCKYGETPLIIYLENCNCSVGIVKLLLHYKADVNSISNSGDSPLLIALKQSRDKTVIHALLKGGAGVDTLDKSKNSPLCNAFRHSSNDIQKLLLDAGSSPSACKYHRSGLFCATDFSRSGLRADILKLMLKTNVNVNSVDEGGQSLMCFCLRSGAKPHDIRLLLASGASLNICQEHSSPLMCATHCLRTSLREDVVQLLLSYDSYVGGEGLKVLQRALRYCNYETGAIQLLLEHPGMGAYIRAKKHDSLLLIDAVANPYYKLDVIKLLVNSLVEVCKSEHFGETALHSAVRNETCDPSLINFLLKNGSPVNATNKYGETPLMVAVKQQQPANILKELLLSGADNGKTKFWTSEHRLKHQLEFLARKIKSCSDIKTRSKTSCKMLVKFFSLQNPECDVRFFKRASAVSKWYKKKLIPFMHQCLSEVRKMDSIQFGHGHTLRMFVSRDSLSVEKIYDLDQILRCLMKNTFPAYIDVISARIGRSVMEEEINKLRVYTNKIHPDLFYVEKVYLNYDVVRKISQYLSDKVLLNFILAFYKPVNQNNAGGTNKDDTVLGKRNSEPSFKLHKHPKLFC